MVRSKDKDGDTMFKPDVVYAYEVNGQHLQSTDIWFGGEFSSGNSSHAYKTANRYPVGKEVEVHYKPDEPSEAVLEPGLKMSSWLVFGIGMLFLVVGVLLVGGPLLKALLLLVVLVTSGGR